MQLRDAARAFVVAAATGASIGIGVPCSAEPAHSIRGGAIEVGVASALSHVEGTTNASVSIRGGRFFAFGTGLLCGEVEVEYEHVRALDRLGAIGGLAWGSRLGSTSLYPFAGITAGMRQDRLGSFRQMHIPIGATFGLRALAGGQVGLRLDYRVLRVLDDPIADYTEHTLAAGLSIYFRNAT